MVYGRYLYIVKNLCVRFIKQLMLHIFVIMWENQCHIPTMTGDGKHTTHKDGDDLGTGL